MYISMKNSFIWNRLKQAVVAGVQQAKKKYCFRKTMNLMSFM